MKTLQVDGLSKSFGGVQAVLDLSFGVEPGEKLAVIGPNGAGKTTLLNLVSGQLYPTAGRICLFEKEITTMPTHRRVQLGLARSFQITRLFAGLTLLDNVLLAVQGTQPGHFQVFRRIRADRRLIAKAQELLESVALWEKKESQAKDLSYGEQRRMEIVLSIGSKPKLLLMDEPSAGLTAAESDSIIDVIIKLGNDITAIIVAHDMDLVFGVANRIMVLHYGQIIAMGTPEEVRDNARVREIYLGEGERGHVAVS